MSAYNEYSGIKFTDLNALVEALQGCRNGVGRSWTLGTDIMVSEGVGGLPLYGYGGDNRNLADNSSKNWAPLAQVVIPGSGHPSKRNAVGSASNDIGFVKNADGEYVPMISNYDAGKGRYDECWMNELKANYLEVVVTKNAKAQGYQVKKSAENGKIKLTLTRWR
jgi:hypothetical protein